MLLTPPKMNNTMLFTFKPRFMATREWQISCIRTDIKSIMATITPAIQYVVVLQPGKAAGNVPWANNQVKRMRAKIQV
jgi:hypothetical protein